MYALRNYRLMAKHAVLNVETIKRRRTASSAGASLVLIRLTWIAYARKTFQLTHRNAQKAARSTHLLIKQINVSAMKLSQRMETLAFVLAIHQF